MLQIRDRVNGDWEHPFEGGSITDIVVKPATMLQHNWQKLQDYFEDQEFSLLSDPFFKRLQFIYTPEKEETGATLKFHLTAKEKRDVIAAFDHPHNRQMAWELVKLLK